MTGLDPGGETAGRRRNTDGQTWRTVLDDIPRSTYARDLATLAGASRPFTASDPFIVEAPA